MGGALRLHNPSWGITPSTGLDADDSALRCGPGDLLILENFASISCSMSVSAPVEDTSPTATLEATTFAYDANGNFDTKTGGWDYDWNPENLMTAAN